MKKSIKPLLFRVFSILINLVFIGYWIEIREFDAILFSFSVGLAILNFAELVTYADNAYTEYGTITRILFDRSSDTKNL